MLILAGGTGLSLPLILQLSIFAILPLGVVAVVCGVLLILQEAHFVRQGKRREIWLRLPILALASVLLFILLARLSSMADDWYDLRQAEARLPALLDLAARECGEDQSHVSGDHGGFYVVDCGPPVRVAFDRGGMWLDNWSAVVFDPTGVVEGARSSNVGLVPGLTIPAEKLFGGDIKYCWRIRGPFFHCRFT